LSKEDEVITVTWKEMSSEGEFDCPKCKIRVSPDHDEDWEDISGTLPEFPEKPDEVLLIKHACGQKIRVDMTGCDPDKFEKEAARNCSEP
jgi:hypothetical protein